MGASRALGGLTHSNSTTFEATALCRALQALPGLGTGERAELAALRAEPDPQFFGEAVFGLATRLEQAGKLELALQFYRSLSEVPVPDALRRRAFTQIATLTGVTTAGFHSGVGARSEFLLRRLAGEAADPTMLAALGTASAVYRVARFATLSRMAAAPAGMITRGIGAEAVAGLAGFAVEAPTFTLASRGAAAALGREQDWGVSALGRDFASSYLVLGGLKLAGWASGTGYGRIAGSAGFFGARPLRTLFRQTGMLGGILLGHGLERWAGLRPAQDGATTLVDSLALLLQFHVAGRLSAAALGPRWAAWERGLDLRAASLEDLPSRDSGSTGWSEGALHPAPAGPRLPFEGPGIWIAQMTASDGPGGGARDGSAPPAASRGVALSPVLRRAMRLHDPKALGEILRMIYARVQGPMRGEILNVLVALESGQGVSSRIRSLLKDGRIYHTTFLSPEMQRLIAERVTEHEQEADLFPPEATAQSLGPKRPNVRAFERMAQELSLPAADLAKVLNRLFAPQLDPSRCPGYRGEPIYLSNPEDEANVLEYQRLARPSLGEALFFARKTLERNWLLGEAARKLRMRSYLLQQLERNQRRPDLKQLERIAEVYQLDLAGLKELRAQQPRVPSGNPAPPVPADSHPALRPSPAPQLALPGLEKKDPDSNPPQSLRLTAEQQLQYRSDRLRQLGQVEDPQASAAELFREAVELAEYFEGIVRETRHRAERDILTGLRNRQGLGRITPRLERRLLESRRQPETQRVSDYVLMIDIDFFKSVNDSYGHPNGDIVLREVAQTLAHTVRWRKDLTARLGGEEFFAFLSASGREGAREAAERIREAVEKATIPLDGYPDIKVTISIGAAELRALPPAEEGGKPRIEGSLADAIERADRALYQAKHSGRNRVVLSVE